jgi:hypothetical protein
MSKPKGDCAEINGGKPKEKVQRKRAEEMQSIDPR